MTHAGRSDTTFSGARSVREVDGPINGDRLTFGRFIDEAGARFGNRPAIVCRDHSYPAPQTIRRSYAELADDVRALHAALADAGVRPGEHVAVMLSSFYEWIVFLFAVTRLGAAFVPLNPRFGSHELAHVLQHSGSRTLVAMGRYMDRDYSALIADVIGDDWSPGAGSSRIPELQRIIGVRTPPHRDALMTDALLERGRTLDAANPIAAADDIDMTAILFYTSGTTAFPKGVPLSHNNLLPHTIGCGALIELEPGDRILSLYPFFGISGGANKVLSTLAFGSCLVFQDAFRAAEAYELLVAERCTVVHGVDVQLRELVKLARGEAAGKSAAPAPPPRRATVAFMAGLDVELARDMGTVLGIDRFVHPYGMTETNPMILRNDPDDPFEARLRPGGRVAPHAQVRVVDPSTGIEAAIDTPGEIEVRGPTVMRGYYRDPEATAQSFRDGVGGDGVDRGSVGGDGIKGDGIKGDGVGGDGVDGTGGAGGWFRTGEKGVRTADGFIFYLGRLKDMLKIGGFNVAPQEVEAYLRTHPAVDDIAVTGVADERLGEVAGAFIKPRAGHAVDIGVIKEFCRGHIANYKTPQYVWEVDALPYHTAANGSKLRRDVLRQWARDRIASESS